MLFEPIGPDSPARAKPKELGERVVGLFNVPVASAIVLVPVLPEPVAGPVAVM